MKQVKLVREVRWDVSEWLGCLRSDGLKAAMNRPLFETWVVERTNKFCFLKRLLGRNYPQGRTGFSQFKVIQDAEDEK